MSDPCRICGSRVRTRTHATPTLGDPDATIEERICLDSSCETNERPRTLGTPTP